jgi:hypothetical protein
MFSNSLLLAIDNSDTHPIGALVLVDGPTNRKTIRSSVDSTGQPFVFTIGHQSSNENPGFDTTRSVVRLETTKVDPASGKPLTAYVQLVLSVPKVGTVFAPLDLTLLNLRLIAFLQTQGLAVPASSLDIGGTVSTVSARLFNEEP